MYAVKVYSLIKEGALKIRPNFRVREFKSPDSDAVFVSDELADILQDVRDVSGDELYISSGYRTVIHNAKVSESKYSQHIYGGGADIMSKVWTPKQLFTYLDSKYPDKYGIGLYSGHVHIDVRPEKVRWFN